MGTKIIVHEGLFQGLEADGSKRALFMSVEMSGKVIKTLYVPGTSDVYEKALGILEELRETFPEAGLFFASYEAVDAYEVKPVMVPLKFETVAAMIRKRCA